MKYKVGDKVKVKKGLVFNEGDIVEILMIDEGDNTYLCKNDAECWQLESDIISLVPLTFQQKLDRFKSERVGFLVKSKEIYDELAKVFERDGLLGRGGQSTEYLTARAWETYGNRGYIAYNYFQGFPGLSYGKFDGAGETLDELLEVTLEELKEYMDEQKSMTLEYKLVLFKAGTHVLHTPTREIYDKLMVELEKRGYAWGRSDKPTGFNAYCGDSTCISYEPYMEIRYCRSDCLRTRKVLTLTTEDFSIPQVITITSDGYHRVTAESNGVTAEALCNPTDKFKLTKGVHLAAQRLLEKLAEPPKETDDNTGFHKGDIVEILNCRYGAPEETIGLQGIISNISRDETSPGAYVELAIKIHGDTTWGYSFDDLKLIRRGNC